MTHILGCASSKCAISVFAPRRGLSTKLAGVLDPLAVHLLCMLLQIARGIEQSAALFTCHPCPGQTLAYERMSFFLCNKVVTGYKQLGQKLFASAVSELLSI